MEENERNWISKENMTWPMIAIEPLLLSCNIGNMEVRDVVTTDITWDFLKTDYYKCDIHIQLEVTM